MGGGASFLMKKSKHLGGTPTKPQRSSPRISSSCGPNTEPGDVDSNRSTSAFPWFQAAPSKIPSPQLPQPMHSARGGVELLEVILCHLIRVCALHLGPHFLLGLRDDLVLHVLQAALLPLSLHLMHLNRAHYGAASEPIHVK